MQDRKITYNEQWHTITRGLPAEVRLEVFDAINSYAFDGVVPALSSFAQGVFTTIRAQIDAEVKHKARISAKRAKAGAKHTGNQKTRKVGTSGTIVPNELITNEIGTNVPTFGTNGTNVPNPLIISEFGTNVPKVSPVPLSKYNIYNTTTPITCVRACEVLRDWLGGNQTTLEVLVMRNKLAPQAIPPEEMLKVLDPYIKAFVDLEVVRDKIERGDRSGTINHFQMFLPRYLKTIKDNEQLQPTNNRGVTSPGDSNTQTPDYWGGLG